MRKIILLFSLMAVALCFWIYVMIPNTISLRQNIAMKANINMVNRALNDYSLWKTWWPNHDKDSLYFNDNLYSPVLPGYFGLDIAIKGGDNELMTSLSIIEKGRDSVVIFWKGFYETEKNPIKRLAQHSRSIQISKDMKLILENLAEFLSAPENIYGIHIHQETVKDTLLLQTQGLFNSFPTVDTIYSLINKLTNTAKHHQVAVTGFPMLNIEKNENNLYWTRVAIPVNTPVKEENGIVVKRIVPGNILVSDSVTGGNNRIEDAYRQMINYTQDFKRTIPGLPFQSLITNRQSEPDSAKWITRIYCPVI